MGTKGKEPSQGGSEGFMLDEDGKKQDADFHAQQMGFDDDMEKYLEMEAKKIKEEKGKSGD